MVKSSSGTSHVTDAALISPGSAPPAIISSCGSPGQGRHREARRPEQLREEVRKPVLSDRPRAVTLTPSALDARTGAGSLADHGVWRAPQPERRCRRGQEGSPRRALGLARPHGHRLEVGLVRDRDQDCPGHRDRVVVVTTASPSSRPTGRASRTDVRTPALGQSVRSTLDRKSDTVSVPLNGTAGSATRRHWRSRRMGARDEGETEA